MPKLQGGGLIWTLCCSLRESFLPAQIDFGTFWFWRVFKSENVAQIAFRGKEWFFSGDPSLRIRTSFKFSNQLLIKWLYSMPIYSSIVSLALLMRILVKQNNALFSTFHRPTSSVRKVWHHTFSPVYDDFSFLFFFFSLDQYFPSQQPPLNPSPPSPITIVTLFSFSESA